MRIPRTFASENGLEIDSTVEISSEVGKLVVAPVAKPQLTLKQLLAKVTPENIHHDVETEPGMGNVVW
jgi:antitoxin component of MazEF toxin-antitoxin module